jgi:hypothetical protein
MRTRAATRFLSGALVLAAIAAGAQAPPPEDEASQELAEYHQHHQHGGISQFTELALDTLGVDAKREAKVDAIHASLHTCTEPIEAKEALVLKGLAEGIAVGTVDVAKLDRLIAEMNSLASNIHGCVAPKLNQLHAALTPVERDTLGDKVVAHWQVWREVNHRAAPGSQEPGSGLGELAKELGLEAQQVEKLSAALSSALGGLSAELEADKVDGDVQRFAKAFSQKGFDATSVTTTTTASLSTFGVRRMVRFYATVAPLLGPPQRATLAAHLNEHAAHDVDEGAGR